MDAIRRAMEVVGLAILLATLILACGDGAEEGALEDVDVDSVPAAEQPIETDAPGDPAPPDAAVEEPDPAVLTDQSQAEERQRSICEAQRASHAGADYRVECTRAVTGDDRAETWQCTCVWSG